MTNNGELVVDRYIPDEDYSKLSASEQQVIIERAHQNQAITCLLYTSCEQESCKDL